MASALPNLRVLWPSQAARTTLINPTQMQLPKSVGCPPAPARQLPCRGAAGWDQGSEAAVVTTGQAKSRIHLTGGYLPALPVWK